MSETAYNGWANYETWNVNLWLANDEGFYNDVTRMARRAMVANTHDEATAELADAIQEFVSEVRVLNGGTFGDLSEDRSFARVDWEEVAASWLEDEED